mmetsp:Transcript_107822/g.337623  ORF Transcript_107822/g.337623 Transcript_107822/m.337623 type:complete len:207 (-) Transcript_107822:156-776(-)
MGLQPLLTRDAPLEGLAPAHILGDPLDELVREHVKHRRHGDGAVRSPHVRLALVVHHEAAIRGLHAHEELVELFPIHGPVCSLAACDEEGGCRGVRGRQMRQLPGSAGKTPTGGLAVAEERGDLRSPELLVIRAQDLHGMGDPEDEPRPRRVQASETGGKLAEVALQPATVEVSVQPNAVEASSVRGHQEGLEAASDIALGLCLIP